MYKKDWEKRRRDFRLVEALAEKHNSILEFIEEYVLEPVYESELERSGTEDRVTIITVHSAKGTESDVCYVINVSPGAYPSSQSIGNEDEVEEDRRVLYVAFTRAKNELIITRREYALWATERNSGEEPTPYFLNSLPEGLFDEHTPTNQKREVIGGGPTRETVRVGIDLGFSEDSAEQTQHTHQVVPDSAVPIKTTHKTLDMTMCQIPAGEFLMGSNEADVKTWLEHNNDFNSATYAKCEQPQHLVKITQPFYMAACEVTQAQFEIVLGRNPSLFAKTHKTKRQVLGIDTELLPVENVTWFDAVEFCVRLSLRENRSPCYRLTNVKRNEDGCIKSADVTLIAGDGFRLPTEAEWEYACRAGTTTAFHYGMCLNSDAANFDGRFPFGSVARGRCLQRPTSVGSYLPNAFGLFDMHGNVQEWCQDWYEEKCYLRRDARDPIGPKSGFNRVIRGGGWYDPAHRARSASRHGLCPESRTLSIGFRVVMSGSTDYAKQVRNQ